MNLEKDTWNVLGSYFESEPKYLSKHHLDSYNDFINNKIFDVFNDSQFNPHPRVLTDKENPEITYLINIYYGGRNKDRIEISRPIIYNALKDEVRPLYPNEARLKNLTYAFNVFCDIEVEYIIKENDVEIYREFSPEIFKKINLGRVPIMTHSSICSLSEVSNEYLKKIGECSYDHGGYFIIEGAEKVCVSRERKSENILYVNKSHNPDFSWVAEVKSVPGAFRYARNTYIHVVERTGEFVIENPYFKSGKSDIGGKYIPLFILFRVLGVETDKEIFEYIFHNMDDEFTKQAKILLEASLENEDSKMIYDQMSALKYLEKFTKNLEQGDGGDIQRNRVERFAILFKNIYDNLYPHVGKDFREKALYLGYCVNKLLKVMLGIFPETDRDSYEYKRVDLSGYMIANLFRDGYRNLQYDVGTKISSAFEFGYVEYKGTLITNIINETTVKNIFSPTSSEEIVLKGFRTGTLSNPGGSSSKKGVIQQIDRRGYISYVGQICRIVTPNDTGSKPTIDQRRLHPSHYGFICPTTIKDGIDVGVKKQLTCLAQVTAGSPTEPILKAIYDGGTIPLSDLHPRMLYKQTKVFLNGRWVGVHSEPQSLVEWIRLLRRNGLINIYTSVSWKINWDEIVIFCDGGRCVRPLYIMGDDKKPTITEKMIQDIKSHKITWLDLVIGTKNSVEKKKIPYIHNNYYHPHMVGYSKTDTIEDLKKHSSVIEYLDNNDMNNVMLTSSFSLDSNFIDYTHCEIHESVFLSLEAHCIPGPEHNPLPRNVYAIGQAKQAATIYATNFMHRLETTAMLLSSPQKPLFNSRLGKYVHNDRLGTGQNVIVAIAIYTGYNQDDSFICCQDSIDLGLLKMDYFKNYVQTEKQDPKAGSFEYFYNPTTNQEREDGDDIKQKEYQDYSQLDKYGFIKEGVYCKGDEIVIGKYVKLTRGDEPPRDMSTEIKGKGEIISKTYTCYLDDTKRKLAKVRSVKERPPIIGDKMGSRYSQKGVMGMSFRRENMPHTKNGIRPDVIINPCAFPTRMTNSQLIESVYTKLASVLGFIADSSAFVPRSMKDIESKLEEYGFEGQGNEVLYDGFTGQQMVTKIFIGPTYYQRFKQMVNDKIHSRASGARNAEDMTTIGGGYTAITRQPLAGRALGGGGRMGEMERDAIICHGIAGFLKETVMERSDKYYTHFCEQSGRIAIVNPTENLFISPDVDGPMNYDIIETLDLDKQQNDNKNKELQEVLGPNTFKQKQTEFFRAYMPYCAKLLIQECEGMGLSVKLRTENSPNRKEEVRETVGLMKEMVEPGIANQKYKIDEEEKELEVLRQLLKERYIKKEENQEETDNEDNEDNEDKDVKKNEDDTESLNMSDYEDEDEPKEKKHIQSGGGNRENALSFYRDEYETHGNLPSIENAINMKEFEEGELGNLTINQTGGGSEGDDLGMTDLMNMNKQLAGGDLSRIKLDPITTSFSHFDRPISQEMSYKSEPQTQSQSGGGSEESETPQSDIKVIELDPNYLMKDDSFGDSNPNKPQSGGGSDDNEGKRNGGKSFPFHQNSNQEPKFENEIFIA